MSITAFYTFGASLAVASLPIALLIHRDFRRQGVVSVPAAILFGTVYYAYGIVTLSAAWLGPDRGSLAEPNVWTRSIGLIVSVLGIGMVCAGRLKFGSRSRNHGLIEDKLISRGIYRWSRNPQYAGTALVLLGASIAGTSICASILTAGFAVLIHLHITKVEEPHLRNTFPDSHTKYCNRTNRYFGKGKPFSLDQANAI